MNTREIVQKARPIAKLTDLLWEASNDPEMAQHLFVTDLLKVGLLVAHADGVLGEQERLAMICVTSLTSFGDVYAELLRWGSMEKSEREMYEENFSKLCDNARDDGLENLQFLSAVQEVDQTKRAALLAKTADAIYGFANLVAEADGTVTTEEHEELNRLRSRLYGQPLLSQSQPSGIPAFESAATVTEQLSGSRFGSEGVSAGSMGGLRDPALKVDSRSLAIGTLVTLLHQLSEADLYTLIDHARQMAGKG